MIIPDSQSAIYCIHELNFEMRNPRNDGWTVADMKQRLWDIKMAVDKALLNAPETKDEPPYEDIYLIQRLKGHL